jgi:hypothetical protein
MGDKYLHDENKVQHVMARKRGMMTEEMDNEESMGWDKSEKRRKMEEMLSHSS